MKTRVRFTVNGDTIDTAIDVRATLLDFIREELRLTGTKKGCDHGQCGACTVLVDGKRSLSCLKFAASLEGRAVITIEGIGKPDALHPLQAAFIKHDAFQCGFCTSGQIMSALEVIGDPLANTCEAISEKMSGNLCRCGAYPNIVAAIMEVKSNGTV
ncbi:2Fe-2S iron-sulfur cluster binding domain-containing protein [Microvirga sp. BT689]|uniref:(2Fe-2S)-binding protein n=1 Tax=Microvirga arvi TaxID=2778731 RepID=UPI0019503BD4|nr:2Fe-2S iron-sulfur cluster-binding protein [Microvirga arvi]MBM6581165.1 2Fe-2S iron-sulfur cluster binding domain-containing protein [Microvirga arvi]